MSNYGFTPAADVRIRKLGHMAYTTAPPRNCDPECPFKNNGCYAENPPMVWRWLDQQSGKSRHSVTYPQMLSNIRRMPYGSKLRLWVGGDFPRNHAGGADCSKATQIA